MSLKRAKLGKGFGLDFTLIKSKLMLCLPDNLSSDLSF
jgi:hypothetical protein